jgi:hypothetical protein
LVAEAIVCEDALLARIKPLSPTEEALALRFDPAAAANADTYRAHDPALWARFVDVLRAVADGDASVRETALRFDKGVAWSVLVQVPGRDTEYQLIWVPIAGSQEILIAHLGPTLRSLGASPG